MAPKSSQRSSLGNSQDTKLRNALKKLCESITREKKNGDTIKAEASVTVLNEALRNCRKHGTTFDASYIDGLASALEDDYGDVCSSIEPPVFGLIVQTMLQVDHCLEAQRVLYLLAASLVRDTNEANGGVAQAGVSGRKSAIAKECLIPLLDYFLNRENDVRLRRWAGTLCIQLVRLCEENVGKLELSSEDLRRSIGLAILEEYEEIIRLICGEFIRTLLEEKVDLQTLWPLGTKKSVYEQFPPPSQGGHGWGQNFQGYIDNLYQEKEASVEATGDLIPISSVSLEPPHAFGVPNQNMVAFLDAIRMTIRAPSLSITSGQILDIPMASIERISITVRSFSQSELVDVVFELVDSDEVETNLDGTIVELQKVVGIVKLGSLQRLRLAIRDFCPHAVTVESIESQGMLPTSSVDQNNASQRSGVSEIISVPRRISRRGSEEPNSIPTKSSLNKSNRNMAITDDHEDLDERANLSAMETTQDTGEPATDGTGEHESAPAAEEEKRNPDIEPVLRQTQTQVRRGNKVKPKAKAPIITADRHNNIKTLPPQQLKPQPPVSTNPKAKVQHLSGKDFLSSQPKRLTQTNTSPSNGTVSHLKKGPKTSTAPSNLKKDDGSKSATRSSMTHPTSSSSKGKDKDLNIDSDEITTPEPNDASTPKLMPPPAKPNALRTQMTSQSANDISQNSGKKKYSLHGLKSTSVQKTGDIDKVYDVPDDDNDDDSGGDLKAGSKKKNAKGKQPAKNIISKAKVGKTATSKAKSGRKSAPAALQQSQAPTRHSQRAAAEKAKSMLHETSDDEEDIEEVAEEISKPGPSQKAKVKVVDNMQNSQKVQQVSKKIVMPKFKPSPKDKLSSKTAAGSKETTAQLAPTSMDLKESLNFEDQAQMKSPDLKPRNSAEYEEDLYGATPQKSQSSIREDTIAPTKSIAAGSTGLSKRAPRDSGIDLASKLDNVFGALDDGVLDTVKGTTDANVAMKLQVAETSLVTGESSEADVEMSDAHDENIEIAEQITEEPATEDNDLNLPSVDEPAVSPFTAPTLMPTAPQTITSKTSASSTGGEEHKRKDQPQNESPGMAGETASRSKSKKATTEATVGEDTVRTDPGDTVDNENLPAKVSKLEKSADVKTKRKAKGDDEAAPPKRLKSDELTQDIVTQVQGPPKQELSKQPKSKLSSPIRRSPRLEAKIASTDSSSAAKRLVDEQAHRKPTLISFGTQGPRNQGRISPLKNLVEEPKAKIQPSEPTPQAIRTDSGRKRKRDQKTFADNASPPSKRRESSPPDYANDIFNAIGEDDQLEEAEVIPEVGQAEELDPEPVKQVKEVEHVALQSTPTPVPENPSMLSRPKNASRLSSQSSKVDINGSPINPARAQVDYIGKLKQRLSQDNFVVTAPIEMDQEVVEEVAVGQSRERRMSEVFGPRVILGSRLKAQPSSLEEVTTRYVAHEKSDQGHYTGIATKEVIAQEMVLPNPFADKSRRTSNFTDRLLASARKEVPKPRDELVRERPRAIRVETQKEVLLELPRLPRVETSNVHLNHDRNNRHDHKSRQSVFNEEETLLKPKHRHINNVSEPDDMTNGSSIQSETSDSSREPLSERPTPNTEWNMALRPHYKTLNDAVHRIADEVIIRLSDEEDRMGLMVEQYRENGSRIVEKLSDKRAEERTTILKSLDGKKQEMVSVYTEAKDFIQRTAEELKESQVIRFEKAWRKQQDEVRKQISEGRKVSE